MRRSTSMPGAGSAGSPSPCCALFPLLAEKFYLQLVTKIMILSIFALSLDLLVGYTGLVSLGHAAYFGVAAYALALAAPASDPANCG